MEMHCSLCGGSASETDGIEAFTEIGFGPDEDGGHLNLCSECLDRRKAKRWEPGGQMTARVLSVLEGTEKNHPQGRYSYLRDAEEGVHLVRLQNEWTRRHAQHEPAGQA